MAVEKLTLELDVKSTQYKQKLLEAQKNLLALQNKALKAGGANEVLAAKIAKATNSLKIARNQYALTTNQLKAHTSQLHKTTNAVTKHGKSQKRSNMAMTQAAYAIDDMQYGFQGVQNNIQAMAVSMGASGPLIIGLTAVVVAIGFFAKKMQKAGKEARDLKKELSEKQGLLAEMLTYVDVVQKSEIGTKDYEKAMKKLRENGFRGAKKDLEEYIVQLRNLMMIEASLAAKQGKIKVLAVDREEAIQTMKDLQKIGGSIKGKSILGIGDDNKLISGKKIGGTGNLSTVNVNKYNKALQTVVDTTREMKEIASDAGDLQIKLFNHTIQKPGAKGKGSEKEGEEMGAAYSHGFLGGAKAGLMGSDVLSNILDGIKGELDISKAGGASGKDLAEQELAQLQAIDRNILALGDKEAVLQRIKVLQAQLGVQMEDRGIGLTVDDKKLEKFKNDLIEIKAYLDAGTISFDEYIRRVDNLTKAFETNSSAADGQIEIGNILQDSLSNLVSGFAQAAGSGESMGNALLKGLGNMMMQLGGLIIAAGFAMINFKATMLGGNPVLAIAAGAALVAAGAAVSASASKAGGGGGSGGGSDKSGQSSVARPNPVRENARVRNSNLIIPVDKLRYGQQVADDNYSGFN